MNRQVISLLIVIVVSVLISCSGTSDVAGTGTQVGNGVVIGVAVADGSGNGIDSAKVYLRDVAFLADTSGDSTEFYEAITDEKGSFQFSGIPSGNYALEIRENDSTLGMHRFTLSNEDYNAGTVSVKPSGSYFGSVDTAIISVGERFYARVYGLNTMAQVNRFGEFYYPRLPAGMQILHIEAADPAIGLIAIDTVWIEPGTADTSDTIYQFPESWARDSIVMEDIITLNSLNLSVEDVVVRNSEGRISEIEFDNVGLKFLVPAFAHLTQLEKLVITNNSTFKGVDPALGRLTSLSYLDLSNNALYNLPFTVSKLENITYLNVENNYLPLGPPMDERVLTWLDQFDPDWRDTQQN